MFLTISSKGIYVSISKTSYNFAQKTTTVIIERLKQSYSLQFKLNSSTQHQVTTNIIQKKKSITIQYNVKSDALKIEIADTNKKEIVNLKNDLEEFKQFRYKKFFH